MPCWPWWNLCTAMHATFSRSCPQEPPTAPSANMTPETLFDCLPLRFTRNEAIDKGEQVGVPAGSVDSLLKRMTERGQLVKVGRGEYEFNARMHTRTCVGVRESASSASFARFLNLKCINMKDFLYFPSMTKGSLALLYFPGSNPRIATRHLMRWINGCPPLMEELSATGYHTSQKVFTSRQVTLINRHLGSPG